MSTIAEKENASATNKLIAEFMGEEVKRDSIVKYIESNKCLMCPEGESHFPMEYHSNWEWLMQVVEKIRAIQLPSPSMIPVGVTIDNYGCYITDGCWNHSEIVSNTESENPNIKELTYKTVVEFIEWYNEKFPKKSKQLKEEKLTFNIGGVDYFKKAKYRKSDCTVLDCFGGANQKCKIEMWNETVVTVDTDELELTEAK